MSDDQPSIFYALTTLTPELAGELFELTPQAPTRVLRLVNATASRDLLAPFSVGETLLLESEPDATEVRLHTMSVGSLPWPGAVQEDAPPPDAEPALAGPAVAGAVQLVAPSAAPEPRRAAVMAVGTPRYLQAMGPTPAPSDPPIEDAETIAYRLAQAGRIVR